MRRLVSIQLSGHSSSGAVLSERAPEKNESKPTGGASILSGGIRGLGSVYGVSAGDSVKFEVREDERSFRKTLP